MANVYGNAVLNLVACGASGVIMLEPRDPLLYHPCRISRDSCSFYVEHEGKIVEDIPAFKRGWIVQERLLSRRNIYFGMKSQMAEITWECFEGPASETAPEVYKRHYDDLIKPSYIRDTERKAFFYGLLDALERLQNGSADGQERACLDFSRMWAKIVLIYTQTKLTYLSDKLVAIAGLAKMIASKAPPNNYIAGIWVFTLPAGLLWLTQPPINRHPQRPTERPAWRGAPSWSWASLDTKITGNWPELLDLSTSRGLGYFLAIIGGCETELINTRRAAFGEYASVKLSIYSVIRPIQRINTDPDVFFETDGSNEFGCSDIVKSVLFLPDVKIPNDTPLFYFTIFRGWAAGMYKSSSTYREEGLVLMGHLDGYIRVGYMRILLHKEERENI